MTSRSPMDVLGITRWHQTPGTCGDVGHMRGMSLAAASVPRFQNTRTQQNLSPPRPMKATKLGSLTVGVCLLTVAGPTAAYADIVTFTFENLPVQSGLTTL